MAQLLANLSGDERAMVERARDLLMRQMNLEMLAAFTLLFEMAEKRKIGVVDIATQLINVSRLLTI